MTLNEFKRAFPNENEFIELKRGLGQHPLQESVVSFSNADGGVIVIGVDDTGQIFGKELTQGVENTIHQIFTDVRNPGRYEIYSLKADGIGLTVISVARRHQGFAQTSDGRVLVRRGARNQALFGPELLDFAGQRTLERFEGTNSGIPLEQASEDLLADVAQTFGWPDPDTLVERLEENSMAVRTKEGPRLTVVGALILLADPSSKLGKFYIDIFRFPGDGTDYDKRDTFSGPIQGQIEVTVDRIMEELGTEPVTLGVRRYELPRLPRVVLREAVANAVAHRSYQVAGTAIRVEIRKDTVRITSPGGLPEPVTIKNIREAQSARNSEILRILRKYKLVEDAGRGVDVMQDEMEGALLDPPKFTDTGHSVEVVLTVHGPVSGLERAWIMDLEKNGRVDPKDRVILVHCARRNVLTNASVRQLLGADRFEALSRLQRLRDAGLLVQSGERGGALYRLAHAVLPPSGVRVSQAEVDDAVYELARRGPLTNARVREVTGLDRIEALHLLTRLVQQGKLIRHGAKRGVTYSLRKKWTLQKTSR
jgi:ATP-dependent DNA helicase RecG